MSLPMRGVEQYAQHVMSLPILSRNAKEKLGLFSLCYYRSH